MSDPILPYGGRGHIHPVPGEDALVTEDLKVGYPGTKKAPALDGLTLRVGVGKRFALVGPNGAGKSTLLKTAAGLLRWQAGQIRIYGNLPGACHHRVAYLEQRSEVDWKFPITVRRMVMGGRYVHLGWFWRPREADHEIVNHELQRLGLVELAARQVSELSGGQQQRLLLARALVQQADLLLFDEPLNAVDQETREVVMGVLDELRRAQKTVLMATHDIGRLEEDFDGAIYLQDGKVDMQRSQTFASAKEQRANGGDGEATS